MSSRAQQVVAKLAFNGYVIIYEQDGFLYDFKAPGVFEARQMGKVLGVDFPSLDDLVEYYQSNRCAVKNIRDNDGNLLWPD